MTEQVSDHGFGAKVPMLRLDGSILPPDRRLAAFAQLASGYSVQPTNGHAFQVDARAWSLGDLLFTTTQISAVRVERTVAHVRADGRDNYSFILLNRGSWTSESDQGFLQVASGQICVMDFTHSWINEGADQENLMLMVPRALVDQIAPDAPPLHGRMMTGASGRMLAEHMFALARHLPEMTLGDVPAIERATISLLSGALGALPQDDDKPFSRQDRRVERRVLACIEQGLMDPGLSVDSICRDAAVSRATLYRAFKLSGGIVAYIQQRRLEAAHARISADTGGTIAEFADLYCFSSPAHFSTAFRRHFGYTPVSARSAAISARNVHGVFEDWRKVLDRTNGTA